MNQLLLILGGGALLYWLSQHGKTPAATTTQAAATTTGTPQTQAPATGTSAQPPAPTGTVATTTPPAPAPSTTTTSRTLAQTYGDLITALQHDASLVEASGNISGTFSQLNWYLMSVTGIQDLPDYYDATGGQEDPGTPINIGVYWGIIQPWLVAHKGMAGLGIGTRPWRQYVGPGGWRA